MTRNRSVRASYRKKYFMGAGPYNHAVAYFSKLRLVHDENIRGWAIGKAENEARDVAIHLLKLLLPKTWEAISLPSIFFIKDLPYKPCNDVVNWTAGTIVGYHDFKYSGIIRGKKFWRSKVLFLNPVMESRKDFTETVFHEMFHHLCCLYPEAKYAKERERGTKHGHEFHSWVRKLANTKIWPWGINFCSHCKLCPK